MSKRADKYLLDIQMSIELIEDFIPERYSFFEYLKDKKTSSAVERHLGIIGEVVNRYDKLDTENPLKNTKQIIALRNRLIHAYDSIDDNVIRGAVKKDLPPFKERSTEIIKII